MRKMIFLTLALILIPFHVQAATILLDPGHGGSQDGAISYHGKVKEKDVNLEIAKALKKELEENYEDIEVKMTREDDATVGLKERVELGAGCDFIISLHNNAIADKPAYDKGATVLVASGNDKEEIALETQKMGANILNELKGLGLEEHGLLVRYSLEGEKYDNGKLMDHYKIVRYGIMANTPAIIVEHAFIDNREDFDHYLSNKDQIKNLAAADARGIARYFGLKQKSDGKALPPLSNDVTTIYSLYNDDWTSMESETKTLYPEAEEKKTSDHPEVVDLDSGVPVTKPKEKSEETTTSEEPLELQSTRLQYKDPRGKADLGGQKVEETDLEALSIEEEKPSKMWRIIPVFLVGIIVAVIVERRHKS